MTTTDTLSQSRGVDDHVLGAFQAFLEGLKVNNPGQLVLIQPHFVPEELFDVTTARRGGYTTYPPVGLLYLAAVAKEVNPQIDIRVIDLNHELPRHAQSDQFSYSIWREILFNELQSCDAPHIGVSYMFGTTKPNFVEVCKFIREHFPGVPLLSGGVQATYDYEELLDNDLCDLVVRNEGEVQFKAFLESSIARRAVAIPWGSAFKHEGRVYELGEPPRDVPVEGDIRQFYSLIDVNSYHKYGSLGALSRYTGEDKPFATVLSNRGCRARCTFCTVRDFNGFGVRQRPVESVIEEIKFLVNEKGIKQIDWLDDDLLWDPKRTVELFRGLATEVPGLEWTSSNGLIAVAVTDEIMYWMVKSGLTSFKIGIESGNDKMLHLIKKPTTKPKLREKRQLFKKYPEVFVSANFIIGFPNETFAEMMDSFNFGTELEWDWMSFNVCQPLKGTEMFSAFQELGDDRCDEENYDKTLNPGRSAPMGEVGNQRTEGDGADIHTGWDVFNLPYDVVPTMDQLKEIWFTFNFVGNFLNNLNWGAGGNVPKIARWFEAIHSGFPRDASMCAALVKAHKLLGSEEKATFYQEKFLSIVSESGYWQRRVAEFPELLEFAGVALSATGDQVDKTRVERNWSGGAL